MKTFLKLILPVVIMSFAASCANVEAKRIVCFGDSLTSCGGEGGRYSDMLQQSLPDCEVVNSGIGGDTLGGGLTRLEKSVLAFKPDYVIVELGANDYWQRRRTLDELKRDYEEIVAGCRRAGAEVLIISCFGNDKLPGGKVPETGKTGLALEEYAAGLALIEAELVRKYDCGYVPDMQCGILPKGCSQYWSDSNHPNAAGNRIVADTILPELRKLMQ